jgi:hypothetical protein
LSLSAFDVGPYSTHNDQQIRRNEKAAIMIDWTILNPTFLTAMVEWTVALVTVLAIGPSDSAISDDAEDQGLQ